MSEHPKVFISYSHQSAEYENKILEFANHLRNEGIDANIDLYEESPAEGWPRWMENQIKNSDFVLIVNSKSYYEKFYSESSRGVSWEVSIVYQQLYDASVINKKFIPVFFDKEEEQYILTPLKAFTFYNVGEEDGFEKLYWRLRGVSRIQKPPLGNLKPLSPKEQRTMFFTTPINIDKWDAAKWRGVLYLFSKEYPPVLGLLFYNYDESKAIFNDWKKKSKNNFADEFIKIDYIVPPFPKDCWVYTAKDRNYGKGYFVHIGPNTEKSINKVLDSGLQSKDFYLACITRFQWMDELDDSSKREFFKKLTDNGLGYYLMPIGIKNKNKPLVEDNLIIDFNYAIKMKNISFKTGLKVDDNDICKVVLNNIPKI